MRKRLLVLIPALLLLIAVPVTVYLVGQQQETRAKAAPATTLALTPSVVDVEIGETFTTEVTINPGTNQVVAAEVHLSFDATKLEALNITNGALFPIILASGIIESGSTSITVGAASQTTPVATSGSVAIVTFKALEPTTAATAITFSADTFVGSLGEGATNVLIGTTPGSVTINGTVVPTATPTQIPATTTTPSLTLTPTPVSSASAEASPSGTISPTIPIGGTDTEASPSALQIISPEKDEGLSTATPTIVGTAPPNATVTITIFSAPQTGVITADENGNWEFTPGEPLEDGPHDIIVTSTDPDTGDSLTQSSSFVVAGGGIGGGSSEELPQAGSVSTTILLIGIGIMFVAGGLIVPAINRTR